jgi:hypothetical protein
MVSLSGVNSFCTDLGDVAAAHAQGANNRTLRKAFGQEILSGLFTKCPFCVLAVQGNHLAGCDESFCTAALALTP